MTIYEQLQAGLLHDNYVDNSALLYIWAEPQPLARRATAARSAAVARNVEKQADVTERQP